MAMRMACQGAPNPRACECAGEQNLACGPCKKCEKRTEDMRGVAQVRILTHPDSHRNVSHVNQCTC